VRSIGTTRRIDQLGRVVIPAELRRRLGLHDGDLVSVATENGGIMLRKVEPQCVICGHSTHLTDLHGEHLCARCLREIRRTPA